MTKQVERYYYYDHESTTVWHTTDDENVPSYFEFLGSSHTGLGSAEFF